MIKYHVKFTHRYQLPQQSGIEYITVAVDDEWEFEEWVNVFTYIYTHFNVISDVEVTQKISSNLEVKS
jgi:alkyl hydroperoxide reductase subunit AhpC